MIPQATRTQGTFVNEPDAWQWFDEMMNRANAFRVLHEVNGEYVQPRPQTELKGARIDRILIPLAKAVDAGWVDGAIGIEGKASGCKIGKLFTQALDYTRCAFTLEKPPGLIIMPTWVFVYPAEEPIGDMESITLQNRIGTAKESGGRLEFHCGVMRTIVVHPDGNIQVKSPPMGHKRGSR